MKRGNIVTVAMNGDFSKPRPALIIQSDQFNDALPETVTVLFISSEIVEAPFYRLELKPDETNGLRKKSQIMIDKTMTLRKEKVGPVFGCVGDDVMLSVSRALAIFLGIA